MRILVALVVPLVGGCFIKPSQSRSDATSAAPCMHWSAFGTIQPITELDSAASPWMSDDGTLVYFASDREGNGYNTLFESTRTDRTAHFAQPTKLGLDMTSTDDNPFLSDDLLTLWWDSARGGGLQIYYAHRDTTMKDFDSAGAIVAAELGANAAAPTLTSDQRTIYFAINDTIWRATRGMNMFAPATEVTSIEEGTRNNFPSISGDGTSILFASDRGEPFGQLLHLWTAQIVTGDTFAAPTALGELDSTGLEQSDPALSRDGLHLTFSATNATDGSYDLYTADRSCLD